MITGDMNFVEEPNLRKLLNKGLSFRLPQARDVSKACESLKVGIVDYVNKLSKRFSPYCSVATWYLWRSIDTEPIQY